MPSRALKNSAEREKAEKYASATERAIQQMDRLIGDLLDFSRIRSGGLSLTLNPKKTSVPRLIDESLLLVSAAAVEKQIRFEIEIEKGAPDVWCDSGRVLQVLSNLIGNAIKFSPVGGKIRIEGASADVDHEVGFAVIDEGPGIDSENLLRVFDKHWQAKDTARLGHGLGLYITQGIVEGHGGRLWVESAPGRGAAFRFTLPSRRPEEA